MAPGAEDAEEIELRALRPEDLPDLLALAHAQGRNVHRSEYERFLGLEGAHGLVLRREGALEGAITVFRTFENGFLGPVLLAGRDQVGYALLLLGRAVEALQRTGVMRLDAEAGDAEASPLAGMGFRPARRTLVLERDAARPSGGAPRTSRMSPHHLLDVGALDAAVVGHGRKEYLAALMEDAPEGARVLEEGGEVVGYVLARRSRRGYHLGPLVTRAGDLATARTLLLDALESVAGWPVVVLAPEGTDLVPLLREAGFSEVAGLTRMRAGEAGPAVEEDAATATEWLLGGRLTG